jgi:hypothetical protein
MLCHHQGGRACTSPVRRRSTFVSNSIFASIGFIPSHLFVIRSILMVTVKSFKLQSQRPSHWPQVAHQPHHLLLRATVVASCCAPASFVFNTHTSLEWHLRNPARSCRWSTFVCLSSYPSRRRTLFNSKVLDYHLRTVTALQHWLTALTLPLAEQLVFDCCHCYIGGICRSSLMASRQSRSLHRHSRAVRGTKRCYCRCGCRPRHARSMRGASSCRARQQHASTLLLSPGATCSYR